VCCVSPLGSLTDIPRQFNLLKFFMFLLLCLVQVVSAVLYSETPSQFLLPLQWESRYYLEAIFMIESNFRQASLKAAMNAPILRNRSRTAQLQENYPHVYDSQREAQQTSGLSYCHYYSRFTHPWRSLCWLLSKRSAWLFRSCSGPKDRPTWYMPLYPGYLFSQSSVSQEKEWILCVV
jgi:hypothetical protein